MHSIDIHYFCVPCEMTGHFGLTIVEYYRKSVARAYIAMMDSTNALFTLEQNYTHTHARARVMID